MKFNIQEIAVKAGGVSAGAVGGTLVNKMLGGLNPKVRALAKIAVGAVGPAFLKKGGKDGFIDHVGSGLIASGAIDLATDFGIAGIDDNIMSGVGNQGILIDEDYEGPVSGAKSIVSGV